MRAITANQVRYWLVSLFVSATIGFLVLITFLIVIQPKFPLNVGLVRTTGKTGLLLTAVPAVCAIVGLFQLPRRRRIGSILLTAYCLFWGGVFLAGLPEVWNAQQSFCLKGLDFCITSPWVGRLAVLAIATPFLLSAWWLFRQAIGSRS
jgi:hypothetical protein